MNPSITAKVLAAGISVLCFAAGCERSESERTMEAQRTAARATENAAEQRAQAQAAEREAVAARETARQQALQGSTTLAFNEALNNIASSRCEHEARCGNVGTGKRYESTDACRTVVRNDYARDLNAADCPAGIDRQELSECVQAVRDESCGNPIEAIGRIAACRTSDMCQATRNVSMR